MALLATIPVETASPIVDWATEDDEEWVLATLTLAFASDPAVRWMYPDPQQHARYFPMLAKRFGGGAIVRGTALVSEGRCGAALWLPPDTAPDEAALAALLEESVADRQKADAFAVFEEMATYHPHEPHWYLPLIGVDPARQGGGHGSAMMQYALSQCDEERLPAYLEATSSRNAALYRRHGFEAIGKITVGSCPPIVPMLRPARAAGRAA